VEVGRWQISERPAISVCRLKEGIRTVQLSTTHILCLAVLAGLPCLASYPAHAVNGLWVHPEKVIDQATADRTLDQAQRSGIDNIYVLVFHREQAWFQTPYCPMSKSVKDGFDPLGYCIKAGHKRSMKVHAWFVNGEAGDGGRPGAILSEHPDWQAEDALGAKALWFDLTKPRVRRFQKDLMLSAVERYPELDGIHFDYIRFPNSRLGYSAEAISAFRKSTGFEPPRLDKFPLRLTVSANPAHGVTTGRVLAEFDTGMPAIVENRLGKGRVLLFNWHAERSEVPALDVLLAAKLKEFGAESRPIRLLFSQENHKRYGRAGRDLTAAWLSRIGFKAADAEFGGSEPSRGDILVVPNIYLWSEQDGAGLRKLVEEGMNVVWIDGPYTDLRDILAVLGADRRAAFFSGERLISPAADDPALPVGTGPMDLAQLEKQTAAWKQWRMDCVSELVRSVYRSAKRIRPSVEVTAAVFYTKSAADGALQDWQWWVRRGYVDYVIPMAYVDTVPSLAKAFDEWEQLPQWRERIIPGLSIYKLEGDKPVPRPADLVQSQIDLCRERGTTGTVFFCCHYISPELEPVLKAARTQ